MDILQKRIAADGKFLPGGVLKVDGFLNHQLDPKLMEQLGEEIARLFAGKGITKILTIEASGIAPAVMAGLKMGVPVVFAKKRRPRTITEAYTSCVSSFTKGKEYQLIVSREFLSKDDNVLFVDDFLAYGNAAIGIIDVCKQAGAKLENMVFVIEKEFQDGRVRILEKAPTVHIESLAVVQSREITPRDCEFMQMAIDLSVENVKNGGGPFGAVIVRDDKIVATGVNRVTANHDPTAHAEVSAIRNACQALGDFKLDGCVIYTSCEPCPMCLSAIYWAGISKIYYGNTKQDAKMIDFDDSFIYDEIEKTTDHRSIPAIALMRKAAQKAFTDWLEKADKIEY